jgi:hypothetical protein
LSGPRQHVVGWAVGRHEERVLFQRIETALPENELATTPPGLERLVMV